MLEPRSATGPGSSDGHRRDVLGGAPVEVALALPVAALVEADRRDLVGPQAPREVEMGLLAGARAVQHDDARRAARRAAGTGRRRGPPAARSRLGGSTLTVRTACHDAPPMAAAQQLSHVYPLGSRINERGNLEVGGCDTIELAREFGTPCFVVAEDDVRARARAFVAAFAARSEDFEVVFASKAFPCTAIYRLLWEEGIGCDVAGGGELALALRRASIRSGSTCTATPRPRAEIEQALEARRRHRRDRQPARHRAARAARARPGRAPARPPAHRARRQPGHAPGDLDRRPTRSSASTSRTRPAAIERAQASEAIELAGLHFHIGSQILELDPYREALKALAGLGEFPAYNLGGGLGVAYNEHDEVPSIEDYVGAKLDAVARGPRSAARHRRAGPRARRQRLRDALRGPERQAQRRHLRGRRRRHVRQPAADALRRALRGPDRFRVPARGTRCHVVGKHCESGDILVRDAQLDDPRPGDVLVTPATGAYGHAMANNYNGALRPPVVFAAGGDARLVVRRDSHEDLVSRDV